VLKYVRSLLLCPYAGAHYELKYKQKQPTNDTTAELIISKYGADWGPKAVGQIALRVHSDGNGYDVAWPKKRLRLDYLEAEELYLVLHSLYREEKETRWRSIEMKRKESK
jgi:hypothetical protein